jgi:hypothetical protein
MDKKEVDALLEKRKPIKISEDKPGLLHKLGILPKEKVIELKPLPYGVLLQITECLMQVEDAPDKDGNLKEISAFINRNYKPVTKMIAYAIRQKPGEPPQSLLRFIEKNLSGADVTGIVLFIISQADLGNFMQATSLITRRLVAKDSEAGQK